MKKLLITLFIFLIGCPAVLSDDLWDNYGDQNTYGQKPVTDAEFNETVKRLQERKNRKKKNKNIPKGEEHHQANETDFLKQEAESLPILIIPLRLKISDTGEIPMGHYQVKGEKINGLPVLSLYQSEKLMAQIPAKETNDDFNEPEIHFVRVLEQNEHQVKIIFGSIDFNAYSVVDIAE